jgi:hypothetical protein
MEVWEMTDSEMFNLVAGSHTGYKYKLKHYKHFKSFMFSKVDNLIYWTCRDNNGNIHDSRDLGGEALFRRLHDAHEDLAEYLMGYRD